ncbi:hypothetical protein BM477_00890 [Boudabousia marimammalium]|uniref:Peptidase M48 domain-containing protein n=2 Tax=Boudabousia marimammalium TaxID=156892 RepID=A0A1Q5PSZ1_9ACTO|nr:hypothetical protein BM477_00890 [Boudabousia marimammalium]
MSLIVTFITVFFAVMFAGLLAFVPELEEVFDGATIAEFHRFISLVLIFPFGLGFLRLLDSAKSKSRGPTVNHNQFPAVLEIVQDLSKKAGLKTVPTVVVVSGLTGLSNSVQGSGESVIMVHSDLLDSPRPNGDLGALRFAIAREIGNLSANHQKVWYEIATTVTQSVPYLQNLLKWTETYTADRYGAALAPEYAGDYFAVAGVSKDCWLEFYIAEVLRRVGKEKLINLLAAWTNPVPPLTWRMLALAELGVFRDEIVKQPEIKTTDLKRHYGRLFIKPNRVSETHLTELVTESEMQDYLERIAA